MRTVNIQGVACPLDERHNEVLYDGVWRQLLEDQDGEFYVVSFGQTIYLDKDSQPNEREGKCEQ